MCYAIPGRVVELKDRGAVVDYFGEHRNVLNEFVNVEVGDYVYAQGGILIDKIDKEDAVLILREWKDRFFELKKLDLKISKIEKKHGPENTFEKILENAQQGELIRKEEILVLLKTNNKEELELLYKTANNLRQKHLKNACCVHGIIEFSNYCRNNCFYCGIRKDNEKLKRYRMDIDEIVETAGWAVEQLGFKALVLQSGEDIWYTTEKLVEIVKRIRKKYGILLFVSVGGRDFNCYKKMYDVGARGVLLRFETSNQELYRKIHSGFKADFQRRIELLKYIDELGYLIATGSLIGLPDQTEEDSMNDILLTKSLNAEMYSFGPMIPHPQTPLADTKLGKIDSILKVIAVSRLVDSNAKILVTTALETLAKENGARLGLLAGANSLMINLTPPVYKNLYSIYPNKKGNDKEVEESIKDVLELLYSLGRAPTDLGI